MKHCIIIIFMITLSVNCLSQSTPNNYCDSVKFNNEAVYISLLINPEIRDTTKIYTVRDVITLYWSKEDYDSFVPNHIDVRVRLYGKVYDYTFDEFRELIWPESPAITPTNQEQKIK